MFVGITRAREELQISMSARRDFRGVRRRTVPSHFLMELPRSEMERVELNAREYEPPPDDELPDYTCREPGPPISTADESATLMTAAEMAGIGKADSGTAQPSLPFEGVEAFRVGMAVQHPKHGLGKIAALSGSGARRTATVNFATAGQRKYVLKESPLRPVGNGI